MIHWYIKKAKLGQALPILIKKCPNLRALYSEVRCLHGRRCLFQSEYITAARLTDDGTYLSKYIMLHFANIIEIKTKTLQPPFTIRVHLSQGQEATIMKQITFNHQISWKLWYLFDRLSRTKNHQMDLNIGFDDSESSSLLTRPFVLKEVNWYPDTAWNYVAFPP